MCSTKQITVTSFALMLTVAFQGCSRGRIDATEYRKLYRSAAMSYHGSDAKKAYRDMNQLIAFTEAMPPSELRLHDVDYVLSLDYARAALLAEHLGLHRDAQNDFDKAVRLASKVQMHVEPFGPFPKTEASLRKLLAEMDPPDECKWKAEPH